FMKKILSFIFYLHVFLPLTSFAALKKDCLSKKVNIYTKPSCIYCQKIKTLMRESNIEFEEKDISYSPIIVSWLVSKTSQYTVPYVFVDDKFIGGYQEYLKLCMKRY
ncbi:MAG: glutaredoxin, partial [Rickettsiaceae bacterium]|nr:glutaredoxin [Rickettsiaceae bacterium]